MPRNPQTFAGSPTSPSLVYRTMARGAQDQIANFLASNGRVLVHPEPSQFFEVPIQSPLPETLNFIR